ncbi:MAG TPA: class I SAM-dependent methyltransferase [Polyangiaceae bacterium]
MNAPHDHDRDLAAAFDGQAAKFERATVQNDPAALERLVAFAALPQDSLIADAGCGPGLVSAAFLANGHRLRGFDLSAEMVARAQARNASYGDRAVFRQRSIFDVSERFDAGVSRFVIHHIQDSLGFIRHQSSLLGPGGILVACDHTTDPDPAKARWHQDIERRRDRTHTRNLTAGQIVDAFAAAGLRDIALREEPFSLDFDEWFDRGTPTDPKAVVRSLISSHSARGFAPTSLPDGRVRIDCFRVLVRGSK